MEPLDTLNLWMERARDRARAISSGGAGVHHGVRAGAAGDRGVRRALGLPCLRPLERSAQRLRLLQLRTQCRACGRGLPAPVLGQCRPADRGRFHRAGGVAADHPQQC
ncbi:hypothetical protein G6F23_015524 [Rhizopus arrhizus]|nr:hypothetical protein G6F23_015524 [Rhizopus arrhizus]